MSVVIMEALRSVVIRVTAWPAIVSADVLSMRRQPMPPPTQQQLLVHNFSYAVMSSISYHSPTCLSCHYLSITQANPRVTHCHCNLCTCSSQCLCQPHPSHIANPIICNQPQTHFITTFAHHPNCQSPKPHCQTSALNCRCLSPSPAFWPRLSTSPLSPFLPDPFHQ